MGFTSDLLTGLAVHLDGAGVATWQPTGAYDPGVTGIFIATVPEHPAGVLALTAYGIDDSAVTVPDSVVGLQVRCRAPDRDPRNADDLADAAYDALQSLGPLDLSTGVQLQLCTRRSFLPMGADASGRWERSDNYQIQVHRPATYRL